ncbi:hypothetical protein [Micromonospora chersina]|uniref:hypothetical protein n=1 Tax=Micromonospora chersina TaxID=47854 RepID=UPI003723C932
MQELTIKLTADVMWRLADAAARADVPLAAFAGAVLADGLEAGTATAQNGVQGVAAGADRRHCCPECGFVWTGAAE